MVRVGSARLALGAVLFLLFSTMVLYGMPDFQGSAIGGFGCSVEEDASGNFLMPLYGTFYCKPSSTRNTELTIPLNMGEGGQFVDPMGYGLSTDYDATISFIPYGNVRDRYIVAICDSQNVVDVVGDSRCKAVSSSPNREKAWSFDGNEFPSGSRYVMSVNVPLGKHLYVSQESGDLGECFPLKIDDDSCWRDITDDKVEVSLSFLPYEMAYESGAGRDVSAGRYSEANCVFNTAGKSLSGDYLMDIVAFGSYDVNVDLGSTDRLLPNEAVNFRESWVPASADLSLVNYERREYFCQLGNLYEVNTVDLAQSGCTKFVDYSDFYKKVDCCPGQPSGEKVCDDNFMFVDKDSIPCNSIRACPGEGDWERFTEDRSGKTIVRYQCIDGYCAEEKSGAECTTNSMCGNGEVCKDFECVTSVGGCGDGICTQDEAVRGSAGFCQDDCDPDFDPFEDCASLTCRLNRFLLPFRLGLTIIATILAFLVSWRQIGDLFFRSQRERDKNATVIIVLSVILALVVGWIAYRYIMWGLIALVGFMLASSVLKRVI